MMFWHSCAGLHGRLDCCQAEQTVAAALFSKRLYIYKQPHPFFICHLQMLDVLWHNSAICAVVRSICYPHTASLSHEPHEGYHARAVSYLGKASFRCRTSSVGAKYLIDKLFPLVFRAIVKIYALHVSWGLQCCAIPSYARRRVQCMGHLLAALWGRSALAARL